MSWHPLSIPSPNNYYSHSCNSQTLLFFPRTAALSSLVPLRHHFLNAFIESRPASNNCVSSLVKSCINLGVAATAAL
eukprot:c22029_g1_i2 orf=479-709(-)